METPDAEVSGSRSPPISRRAWLGFTGLAGVAAALGCRRHVWVCPGGSADDAPTQAEFAAAMASLERRLVGRVGVYAFDSGSRQVLRHREDERFAMCSTFKLPLAAAVLARADAGELDLDEEVPLRAEDMLSHAPVTSARLTEGKILLHELCAGAVHSSDNPAANLLLGKVGGPEGFTRFLREHGDEVTRLDRIELELNQNLPGDPRDTTTPRAMAGTVQRLLFHDVLAPDSRERLIGWLRESKTGGRRLRAGMPADWLMGDKTGTGGNGALNDVLVAWPPSGAPLLVACYLSESSEPAATLEQAHAEIGARVAAGLRPT